MVKTTKNGESLDELTLNTRCKKYIMKLFIFITCFIFFSFYSYSQTIYFSGSINEDTTWAADTVKIIGDVTIHSSAMLTILPGTHIEFQGHFQIGVHGTIEAIGTETDSICFTINDTTGFHEIDSIYGGWHGLRFSSWRVDTSLISYCKLEYAKGTDGLPGYTQDDMGSAVYCTHSNLSISHCVIENNNSVASGAVCFENNSNSKYNLVSENLIRFNKTHFYGAGVYSYVSSPQIINNRIFQNYAEDMGGGILCSGSTPMISSNLICNNKSGYSGGGIAISWGSTAKVVNNLICNNSGSSSGGLIISSSDALLANNTICNNLAYNGSGGGMGVSGSNIDVYNSIYWGNSANMGQQITIWSGCTINFNNCNIEGDSSSFYLPQGPFIGSYNNNLNTNPNFVYPSAGSGINYNGYNSDWSLLQNSICINSGSPDTSGLMLPERDVYGNERIVNSIVDIGAAEYQSLQRVKLNDEHFRLLVFPNPANEFVNLSITIMNRQEIQIIITDLNGRNMFNEFINCNNLFFNKNIDLSSYMPGVYYITVINKNKIINTKSFIKR